MWQGRAFRRWLRVQSSSLKTLLLKKLSKNCTNSDHTLTLQILLPVQCIPLDLMHTARFYLFLKVNRRWSTALRFFHFFNISCGHGQWFDATVVYVPHTVILYASWLIATQHILMGYQENDTPYDLYPQNRSKRQEIWGWLILIYFPIILVVKQDFQ